MTRLPIRLRLTLAFGLAMAVVLAVTGAFVYFRVESSLNENVDESLGLRLTDAVNLARADGATGITTTEEGFTEITTRRVALDTHELDGLLGVEGKLRVRGAVVDTPQGVRRVRVGASLADRDEALRGLLVQLLLVAPAALLVSSLLGYLLARAALRPVEAMRAEASAISGAEPGRRLPSPATRDEVGRLAETLNDMLGRLEDALARERAFVADASHELRTPLALLKAELELARDGSRTEPELREAIRSAADETDRLVRLAEDLLVLARADEGKLPLRREQIRVGDLLERVRRTFESRADREGRRLETRAGDGVTIEGDGLRLEQALGNLLDNAFRHASGRILLQGVDVDGRVDLHVIDEGRGFEAGFLPRAFERFRRADEARAGGGAGLGLAIAAAIAEAHGGSAGAANVDGSGADVWLSIPAAGPPAPS